MTEKLVVYLLTAQEAKQSVTPRGLERVLYACRIHCEIAQGGKVMELVLEILREQNLCIHNRKRDLGIFEENLPLAILAVWNRRDAHLLATGMRKRMYTEENSAKPLWETWGPPEEIGVDTFQEIISLFFHLETVMQEDDVAVLACYHVSDDLLGDLG